MSLLAAALALAVPAAAQRAAVSPERLALVRDTTEVRVSPDGKDLAFVTDITGALELWTVPAKGGWPTQLSSLSQQVSEPWFAPDGKTVYFASDFGGDERPDLYRVAAAGGEVEDLTVSTRAETSPRPSPDGRKLAFLADPGQPFLFQLFTLDLSSHTETQLTHETVNVHFPVWSPDAKTIAVLRSGDDQKGELMLVDARGKEEPRVIDPPVAGGITIPEDFSADGRTLLCRSRNEKGFLQLWLLDVKTGRGEFIGPDNWDVEDVAYHPIAGIVYALNEGGASGLYRLRTPRGKPETLVPAAGHVEHFDVDAGGGVLAYLWSDSQNGPDVWLYDLKTGYRQKVTRSMLAGVKPDALSRGRLIKYKSFDERDVTALYIPPRHPRLGAPPPLVVVVHGGPDWQTFDDFSPLRQSLAEAGFAVLAPNFRGSTGYGREWLELNRKDWGGDDRQDLIFGVKYLAKKGEIDPKRVGITGGSYGGFMTLYALARNKGEWAAGAEAYGMPDLVQDYELTKDRFADWYATQMGTPQTDAKLFHERSAIHYLDDITVPLLIFQGENDTNVPLAESKLIYEELKKRGRDVELVVYPDEGHGFTRRAHRTDYYKRLVAFFTRTLAKK